MSTVDTGYDLSKHLKGEIRAVCTSVRMSHTFDSEGKRGKMAGMCGAELFPAGRGGVWATMKLGGVGLR